MTQDHTYYGYGPYPPYSPPRCVGQYLRPEVKRYMDIHREVKGVTPETLVGAHRPDPDLEEKYGVIYLKSWYDEKDGAVFCLAEAPSREAIVSMHQDQGLLAEEVFEIREAA